MTIIILVTLVGLAVAAVFYVGLKLARVTAELEEAKALAKAQKKAINAMTLAIGRESKLRDTFQKIHTSVSPDELNELYKGLLSGVKGS